MLIQKCGDYCSESGAYGPVPGGGSPVLSLVFLSAGEGSAGGSCSVARVRMRRMRASSGSGDPGLTGSKRCFCEATFLCLSLLVHGLETQVGWICTRWVHFAPIRAVTPNLSRETSCARTGRFVGLANYRRHQTDVGWSEPCPRHGRRSVHHGRFPRLAGCEVLIRLRVALPRWAAPSSATTFGGLTLPSSAGSGNRLEGGISTWPQRSASRTNHSWEVR